jgi:valyl-tRNA synthetase
LTGRTACETYTNFLPHQIYQATKYVIGRLGDSFTPQEKAVKSGKESLPERFILHQLNLAAKRINEHLDAKEFSLATQVAYKYFYVYLVSLVLNVVYGLCSVDLADCSF